MTKFYVNKVITIILLFFVYLLISAGLEHTKLNIKINNFKNEGVLVYETSDKRYYEIERKDYMRDEKVLYDNSQYYGIEGDIFMSRVSPFDVIIVEDIIYSLFGGHAAIIMGDGSKMIEAQGNRTKEENVVRIVENSWHTYRYEMFGVRVKNATEEDYENSVLEAQKKLGNKYNYSFVFNTNNWTYCTDLISKSWSNSNFNLNQDRIATTVYDLLDSDDIYLCFYQELKDDKINIYYVN